MGHFGTSGLSGARRADEARQERERIDPQDIRRRQLQDAAGASLAAAQQKGRQRGEELFGGGLDLQAITKSVLEQAQAQAQGLSAPQFAGLQSRAQAGINQQLQNALRQQRSLQGASGVRGAAAQAGGLNLQQGALQQQRLLQGDLLGQDIALQRGGLANLSGILNRERLGQLQTEFGQAGLELSTLGLASQQALAERFLGGGEAARAAAEGQDTPGGLFKTPQIGGLFGQLGGGLSQFFKDPLGATREGAGRLGPAGIAGLLSGGPVGAGTAAGLQGLFR